MRTFQFEGLQQSRMLSILYSVPQTAKAMDAAEFLDACAAASEWPFPVAKQYFQEKGRQVVLEFLGEAEQALR